MNKIDEKKIQAYNLLKQININIVKAKELQKELNRIEEEIFALEKGE